MQKAACWVVTNSTADPRYAYVANAGSGSISGYRIDSAGALSLLDPSGQTAVTADSRAAIDSAVSADSKFLYVVTGGFSLAAEAPPAVTCNAMSISAFRIEPGGNLTPLPAVQGLAPDTQGIVAV